MLVFARAMRSQPVTSLTYFAATERVAWQRIILITFLLWIAVLKYTYHVCEEESILLKLTLGDGSQDESEVESYDSCAVCDKQQEEAANKFRVRDISSCKQWNLPRVTVSPGAEEPAALEGTSVTGPNTGLEGADVAGPSSGSEGTSVASAGSVEMGIDGPRSRVSEETGSVLEDIPGTGGEETTAEITVHSTQRTPQEIWKDFAEDWLETLGEDEIKSIAHWCIGINE